MDLVKFVKMASCANCKKDVGCSCNLINNFCHNCYINSDKNNQTSQYIDFNNSLDLTTIEGIIKSKMTKQEKLDRINNIIKNKQSQ